MLITDTKAFVMQVPASLAHAVEHMAATRGYPMSLVFEQALREWAATQAEQDRPDCEGRAEAQLLRAAAREEIDAWGAQIDADTAPA